MSRDGATVLLAPLSDGAVRPARTGGVPPPGWDVYVEVSTGVDALHEELRGRGAPVDAAPNDAPHGFREFGTRDPDGHRIGFGQPLDG